MGNARTKPHGHYAAKNLRTANNWDRDLDPLVIVITDNGDEHRLQPVARQDVFEENIPFLKKAMFEGWVPLAL